MASLPQGTTHLLGPWIKYEDDNGEGWAQPDYIALLPSACGIIVEAKRTRTLDARMQLQSLYLPLCKLLFPSINRWVLIAACKYWDGRQDLPIVRTPAQAYNGVDSLVDYHWKG